MSADSLGKPVSEDNRVLGDGFPRIAEVKFFPRDDGKYVVAQVQDGDGRDYAYWILGPKKKSWQPVAPFGTGTQHVAFGPGDALYLPTVFARSLPPAPNGRRSRRRSRNAMPT
jgi:prolyl oligopeptidase